MEKLIPGCPDYCVNRKGEIISYQNKNKRKILKPNNRYRSKRGWESTISLKKENGGFLHKSIARLVADNFIPNPHNKPIIHHIDGDATNNNVDNLKWVDFSEHLKAHGKKHRKGNCTLKCPAVVVCEYLLRKKYYLISRPPRMY